MLNSAVSAHRIRELMDLPAERHDPDAFAEVERTAAQGLTVSLNDVSFAYQEGENIYTHAAFTAAPGEIVAVLAPSGGGKTTFMRLLLGMLEPDSGSVTLTTADGREVPVNADLRTLFSYVPQGNTVLSGTVADNLRMVREDATDEELIAALKTACAWEFVEKLSEGINGRLGERGRGISEGQAQRLSIARALLRRSPILLLDEATSALDVDTEERVLFNFVVLSICVLLMYGTGELAGLIRFRFLGYGYLPPNVLTRALPYVLLGGLMRARADRMGERSPLLYLVLVPVGLGLAFLEFELLSRFGLLATTSHALGLGVTAYGLCAWVLLFSETEENFFAASGRFIARTVYALSQPAAFALVVPLSVLIPAAGGMIQTLGGLAVYPVCLVLALLWGRFRPRGRRADKTIE